MTLLEFKEAKKHYRKISKNHNLTAKIKKGNWTAVDVMIWWMKYTKSKEFKELYKGKIAVRPDIYYSKDNVWKRMSAENSSYKKSFEPVEESE